MVVRFLPPLCFGHKKADPNIEGDSEESPVKVLARNIQSCIKQSFVLQEKGMNLSLFMQAFPRYALGAAATGQLDFHDAMQHYAHCISIANAAKAEGRSTLLAVLYDEKAR